MNNCTKPARTRPAGTKAAGWRLQYGRLLALVGLSLWLGGAWAITEEQAQQLGKTLTPMGANPAGNAAGTIPAYTGKILGAPKEVHYKGTGHFYPSAYADEQPLFVITRENYLQYAGNLTEGQIALFKAYPDTFRMPVYPSKRDTRYSDFIHRNVKLNATSARLVEGGDGVEGDFAAVPFPIPGSAVEAVWNGQYSPNLSATHGEVNIATVYDNDEMQLWAREEDRYFELFDESVRRENFSGAVAKVLITYTAPAREKGKVVLVHEFANLATSPRNAWQYIPGSRRVRRAPTIAYDFPDGPGGLRTVDDAMMFIGATDRFDWKLEPMREVFVPYNNNALDDPAVRYAQLLTKHHLNPDYMRYELHRCWSVVGELRLGARHIYGKRRLYLDEDSWGILLADNYDRQGKLFRTNFRSFVNLYDMPGMGPRVEVYHDLVQKAYQANNLVNELDGPPRLVTGGWPPGHFTPSNLRMVGTR